MFNTWTLDVLEGRIQTIIAHDQPHLSFSIKCLRSWQERHREVLLGYLDEMHEQTVRYLSSLSEDYLDRIVRWKPLVMVAVRLVSDISDDLQSADQAACIRGALERG